MVRLTNILLASFLFLGARTCVDENPRWWNTLDEIPYTQYGIVDYNSDGEIDVRDAIFDGVDANQDSIYEQVHIRKFRTFFIHKGGGKVTFNFWVPTEPDEVWHDFDGDGLYDSKIFRNDKPLNQKFEKRFERRYYGPTHNNRSWNYEQ